MSSVAVGRRRLTMAVQVDSWAEGRPGAERAFDPRGILLHALQGVELFFELGRWWLPIGHALGEALYGGFGFVQLAAFDDLGHHRRRGLADRTAASGERDFANELALLVDADRYLDLVAAQRVMAAVGERRVLEPAVVARVLVVVEDDFPRQIVGGHCLLGLHTYLNSVTLEAAWVGLDGL